MGECLDGMQMHATCECMHMDGYSWTGMRGHARAYICMPRHAYACFYACILGDGGGPYIGAKA